MKEQTNKKEKRTVKAVIKRPGENGLQVLEAETELAETPLESQIEVIARKIAPTFAGRLSNLLSAPPCALRGWRLPGKRL